MALHLYSVDDIDGDDIETLVRLDGIPAYDTDNLEHGDFIDEVVDAADESDVFIKAILVESGHQRVGSDE